jgi:hypothetical protein
MLEDKLVPFIFNPEYWYKFQGTQMQQTKFK